MTGPSDRDPGGTPSDDASGDASDDASGDASDGASGDASDGASGDASDGASGDRPRVLLDVMCGTLATYLRMCGYDAAYALDRGIEADDRLLALARDEDRLLITRDRELAARADDALLVTGRDVLDQLRDVADAGHPVELADEPRRCGACNGPLVRVGGRDDGRSGDASDRPGDAADRPSDAPARPDHVPDAPEPAWRCRDCGQWFWKGSHWDRTAERLAAL